MNTVIATAKQGKTAVYDVMIEFARLQRFAADSRIISGSHSKFGLPIFSPPRKRAWQLTMPPGPNHAFDSAWRRTNLAEVYLSPAYIECAAKADGCALSSVFKFVH